MRAGAEHDRVVAGELFLELRNRVCDQIPTDRRGTGVANGLCLLGAAVHPGHGVPEPDELFGQRTPNAAAGADQKDATRGHHGMTTSLLPGLSD